jgi:hypothetical protein
LHDCRDERERDGKQRNTDPKQVLDSGKPRHSEKATPIGVGGVQLFVVQMQSGQAGLETAKIPRPGSAFVRARPREPCPHDAI